MKIKFKRDTAFRKSFFVPDSFAHPAKMDAQLLIWIIVKYTKVGDVILDPMAGSGTTMLACGLGRDVMLVELEEKFCKMMRDNWEKVRMRPQLGYQMGGCQIIQGDARQLEGLVDKIVTSPPYTTDLKKDRDWMERHYKGIGRNPKGYTVDQYDYELNKENISNLPYGEIDKCIFSPPYAEQIHPTGETAEKVRATNDPKHLGKYSQPLLVNGYSSENKNNIGNLPYGQIDKIVTSPPFQEPEIKRGGQVKSRKGYNYGSKLKTSSEHPDNISRLAENAYGNIDSIITSPPYSDISHSQGDSPMQRDIIEKKKTWAGQEYSDSPENIGNLKSDTYLQAMLQVYQQCHKVLKPQGLMILVTKNFIRNKQVVRLDTDTIKLCEQAGFEFLERHYRKLPSQSFWRVIYHQKHPEVEQINFEDVLVFSKP